jgi:hypothetical protein
MRPCWLHFWAPWAVELFECPDGDPVVIELWMRYCRRCRTTETEEVVLSCVSS